MPRATPRRIGLLAGGGRLPVEVAESIRRRGIEVVIVGIDGEADSVLSDPATTVVNWGQIGRMISLFKAGNCAQMVFVGSVRRPDLGAIKPDAGFFMALPTIFRLIRAGGDDAVLRGVVAFFERKGIEVTGAASVAPDLLIGPGPQGRHLPSQDHALDISQGLKVIAALGRFDIGQGVVVSSGRVEAIEGVDGTDAMLDRLGLRRRAHKHRSSIKADGVLVKQPKPGQELRVDLPVVGPSTAVKAAETNLAGIAVLAGHVLGVEKPELIARADALGVFLTGVEPDDEAAASTVDHEVARGGPANVEAKKLVSAAAVAGARRAGWRRLSRTDLFDAIKGGQVARALTPYDAGRAVVVSRGHVFAVAAADEAPVEVVERIAGQRQWGDQRWARRSGIAVLASVRDMDAAFLRAVARAGLAGVAVTLKTFAAGAGEEDVRIANELGLGVVNLPAVVEGVEVG